MNSPSLRLECIGSQSSRIGDEGPLEGRPRKPRAYLPSSAPGVRGGDEIIGEDGALTVGKWVVASLPLGSRSSSPYKYASKLPEDAKGRAGDHG